MYAVIKCGGKQYKVKQGGLVKLEKLDCGIGETVELNNVLMIGSDDSLDVGTPYIEGAKVIAEVVDQARAKKINIIKFRRRKHSMKRQGHRQYYTEVKIKSIEV